MRLYRGACHYGRELPGQPFDITAFLTRVLIVFQRKLFAQGLKLLTVRALDYDVESADETQRLVTAALTSDRPAMIARFGSGEMELVMRYYHKMMPGKRLGKIMKMLVGKCGPFWYDNSIRSGIHWIAGVFPNSDEVYDRFAKLVLQDCREIDVLGGWVEYEQLLHDRYFPNASCYPFRYLVCPDSPFSWARCLKGKKVLVISPFADTITAQYAKRRWLFSDPEALPDFQLITYKPVVSHAGAFVDCGQADWFEALSSMLSEIEKIDFDVALVSAGAYGMNLAAAVKRMGKKAIHVGGALQILFGIKGAAFDRDPLWNRLYNDHWVRPSEKERPKNYKTVEGGSYW